MMQCICGCNREADWLISGTDFDGTVFKDSPACSTAADYCAEAAQELGDTTFTRRRVDGAAKREGQDG